MTDLLIYTDRIVLRYKPRMIVVNEGGNDIHSGRTPEQLLADIQTFVNRVRAPQPDAAIAFSGLTPSPARWSETDTRLRFNQMLKGYLATGKNLIYLDLFDSYLGADGKPREELFVEDKLHHSAAGYAVRIRIMRPILGVPDFQDEGPGKALRIAVVQQDANPGRPEENRYKALRFARQALEQGAEVILFHEELLVGYVKDLRELAEPVDGPTTRAFQSLLGGSQALVIYGLTERDRDKYFISATVVSANGVLTNYHKTHLWWRDKGVRHELTFYQPGDRLVTFNVEGHKCGLMICYDGDFPEMTRAYANRGCSVLFWLNNRGSRGEAEVKDLA